MKKYILVSILAVVLILACVDYSRVIITVKDTSGAPVKGFDLCLEKILTDNPGPPLSYETDSTGTYIMSYLGSGSYLLKPCSTVVIDPPMYILTTASDDTPYVCNFVVDSVRVPNRWIGGNMRYMSSGEPVEGIDMFLALLNTGAIYETVTDLSGEYIMGVLRNDSVAILTGFMDADYVFPQYYSNIRVFSVDTMFGYNFILADSTTWPGYTIEVGTIDSGDEHMQGVTVEYWLDEAGSQRFTVLSGDKNPLVLPADSGRYILRAEKGGLISVPLRDTVELSSSTPVAYAEFVFSSPYWIYAYAEDSIGAPVESLYVQWRKIAGGGSGWMWTGSDGYGVVQVMDSGSYFLGVSYGDPDMMIIPPCDTTQLTASAPIDTVIFRIIPDTTGIAENKLPDELGITAYPNPFNSAVTLEFCGVGATYRSPGQIAVEIYDIHGRLVYAPSPSALLPKGEGGSKNRMRTFIWTPDETLPSGVYFIKAQIEDRTITEKVVLLR